MSIKSGTSSLTFFYAPEPVTEDFWNYIDENIKKGSFKPCGSEDTKSSGFVLWDNLFSSDFNDLSYKKGDYLAFQFRLDQKKIPPLVLKQHLHDAIGQFKKEKKRAPSKKEQQVLKEAVENKLLKVAFACPTHCEVLWNTRNFEMIIGTTSNRLIEAFLETFENVFKVYPVPLYHLQWAINMRDLPDGVKDTITKIVNPSSHKAFKDGVFIGQDFLIWLWYCTETNQNSITTRDENIATIYLGDKLVLVDPDEGREKVVCNTPSHKLDEAKTGLKTGKRLQEAQWLISVADREYYFVLDTSLWVIKNLKTPSQVSKRYDDDPDGRFFEKMFFIEEVREILRLFYKKFLMERFSGSWETETGAAILDWMNPSSRKNN